MIAVTWQALFTFIGAMFDTSLNNIFQNGTSGVNASLLSHTMQWDAGWYMHIIRGGYSDPTSAAAAFYPLFPLIVTLLHTLTFGLLGYATIGLIINTLALAVALYAIKKISAHFLPVKFVWWPVILFITSPAAIFMHFFYTEAVFCAIAFTAYMFALQRKWLLMGILLALLTSTRLPSLLFIGLCGLEFMRAYDWNIKKIINPNLLYFLLAPLGFLLYGAYLLLVRDDFLGMFTAYSLTKDWAYQVFNPNIFETYHFAINRLVEVFSTDIPLDEGQLVNYLMPLVALAILLASSIYLILAKTPQRVGIPLGIFGIVSVIFVSLNSNLISVNRYVLPCLGIYIVIALISIKSKYLNILFYVCCYAGILLQAYLLILFINNYFAG